MSMMELDKKRILNSVKNESVSLWRKLSKDVIVEALTFEKTAAIELTKA